MYRCAATTQICTSGYLILTEAKKDGTHKEASGHGLYDYKWNYCALQDMIHTTTSNTTVLTFTKADWTKLKPPSKGACYMIDVKPPCHHYPQQTNSKNQF